MASPKNYPAICKYCNESFFTWISQINRGKGEFCSISCGVAFRNKALALGPEGVFHKKVIKSKDKNGCWVYPALKGYGKMMVNGKVTVAHRFSYELHNGKIPEGMLVLHKCDNRPCVNPDHLFLGTYSDNTQDMLKKNRGNAPRGSCHFRSTLTENDIAIIKKRILNGEKMTNLAHEYNVSWCTLYQMKGGKSWRHVAPAA